MRDIIETIMKDNAKMNQQSIIKLIAKKELGIYLTSLKPQIQFFFMGLREHPFSKIYSRFLTEASQFESHWQLRPQ